MKILFYGFGHYHIYGLYKKAVEDPEVEIVELIEEDDTLAKRAEGMFNIKIERSGYLEALKNPSIDAVAIGKEFTERGPAIIAALKHGKHVIADKPICTSLKELKKIEKLSQQNNLKIACMLDLRYYPQTKKTQEVLNSLGEVRNVSFTGQHCIDYANRPAWYFKGKQGGTINDLAVHGVDLVRLLTGMEFTKVDFARCWNSYAYKNPDFLDCATFAARLSNGAEVLADVSYSGPSQIFSMPTYWNFKFWCEKGMLTFSLCDYKVTVYEEDTPEPIVYSLEDEKEELNWLVDFKNEIDNNLYDFTKSVIDSSRAVLKIQEASK